MFGNETDSPADDVRQLDARDPTAVGGYPLLGRIGAGGMGTVYLGRDPRTGGRVAVKMIHSHLAGDPAYLARFRDEAVLAARVASFCTARVLAQGEEDGRPYIVSEYVGGVSLHHRVIAGGPMPPAELHGVAVSTASALAAIHCAGLIHRDLKPANVMLTLSGCRVIDFGIARTQDSPGSFVSSGAVLGTPGWMPPEVVTGGAAAPASDVFAWGCLVAYAGTGRLPFGDGAASAVALRVMSDEPDLTGLPDALLPSVRAALSKRPEDRPTAPDLLLALVRQAAPHTEPPAAEAATAAAPAEPFAAAGVPGQRPAAPESPLPDDSGESTAAWVPPPSLAPTGRPEGDGGAGPVGGSHAAVPQRPNGARTRVLQATRRAARVRRNGRAGPRTTATVGAAASVALVFGLILGMGGDTRTPAPQAGAATGERSSPARQQQPMPQIRQAGLLRPHRLHTDHRAKTDKAKRHRR